MSERYPYHDEDWLLDALGESSVEEIAEDCDVTPETIERWIDKHGIVHSTESRADSNAELTREQQEGESVERESIDSDDVETGEAVEVSEEDVHSDDEGVTVSTESEKARAHPSTSDFPEEIQRLGVGQCQCCGAEAMLGAHTISGAEEESVCAKCDEYLRGKTINTKNTILENPTVPHWSQYQRD